MVKKMGQVIRPATITAKWWANKKPLITGMINGSKSYFIYIITNFIRQCENFLALVKQPSIGWLAGLLLEKLRVA